MPSDMVLERFDLQIKEVKDELDIINNEVKNNPLYEDEEKLEQIQNELQ